MREHFPFFSHRTMAEVMRDEARDEAVLARKERDRLLDSDRNVRMNNPANDPFASRPSPR